MTTSRNAESRLWQKVKNGLTDCFLTRIESSTINGIPDVHGVLNSNIFWIELKSDKISFPPLNKWQVVWINKYLKAGGVVFILYENLGEALSERRLELYRPVSVFTDPRSLDPVCSFSFPVQWPLVQAAFWDLLQRAPEARSRSRDKDQRIEEAMVRGSGSITSQDLSGI